MYNYEKEIFELSKLIPQEHPPPKESLKPAGSARLRAKIEKDWATWEILHPEQVRSGFEATEHVSQILVGCPARLANKVDEEEGGDLKDLL